MTDHWQSAAPEQGWSQGTLVPVQGRRRSHRVRNLVIVLLVLLGLVVAADRIGVTVAQHIAANQIKKHENLPSEPTVKVHGVPFLNQFLTGKYGHVTVTVPEYIATHDGRSMTISDITLELHSVDVARNFSSLSAGRGTAHATVKYADLSATLGADVRYAGDGRISATKTISVLGIDVDGTVSATPTAAPTTLSFTDISAKVKGASVPDSALAALTKFFATSVDLSDLPFGITLKKVAATESGLEFDLSGTDLTYSG